MRGLRRLPRMAPAILATVPASLCWLAGCGSGPAVLAQAPPPVTRLQKPADPPAVTPPISPEPAAQEEASELQGPRVGSGSMVQILAKVNGRPIFRQEVDDAVRPYLGQLKEPERSAREKELRAKALGDLIDREILLHDLYTRIQKLNPQTVEKIKEDAEKEWKKYLAGIEEAVQKSGVTIKSKEHFKQFIREQGMDLDYQHQKFERDHVARTYLNARVVPQVLASVGRQQIYDYYHQHETDFQVEDGVEWQEIFIAADRFGSRQAAAAHAAEVAAQARAGADFLELVKKYDQGDSSYRNGQGEGRRRGEIRPTELEAVVFELKEGEVGPVVEFANGFRVVRVAKREYAGRKKLDHKLQDEIRHKLQNEMLPRESRRFIEGLKVKAAIELAPEMAALQKAD